MSEGRLIFMGSPQLAVNSLAALAGAGFEIPLVVTQPDRRAGRGRKPTPCPVAAAAAELSLATIKPEKVAEAADDLRRAEADALVVVAYGQILPPKVLAAGRLGAVNLHASLLPKLRGAAPINWAIVNGEEKSGVTTMFMDQGLDTGDMILRREIPLDSQETAGTLADKVAAQGAGLLLETMRLVLAGTAPRAPQDHAQATWAPRLSKNDGLVDFRQSARDLDRRVRGFHPWPGCHTLWQGKPLKLYPPTMVLAGDFGPPGLVVEPPETARGMLAVSAGQGALAVGEVQAPGKKRIPARDFLRGSQLAPGAELGN